MKELIHIYHDSHQEGPYTIAQVQELIKNGSIAPFSLAWKEGMSEWLPLNRIVNAEETAAVVPPPLPSGDAPPEIPESRLYEKSPSVPAVAGPKGVGGWLLFFCICLTIIGPIGYLATLGNAWEETKDVVKDYPSFRTALLVTSIGCAILAVYGIYIGCTIWGGSPNGRKLAKQFLLTSLVVSIGLTLFCFFAIRYFPTVFFNAMAVEYVKSTVGTCMWFFIWWSYFKKSKRVRNTYGPEL
ncbi:MAG: DUF2569 family protein [Candidatus Hydrogenedentes bacterium]|nr:DUF2569 family protein [Candidatus Hydrogenedentota bacterium]